MKQLSILFVCIGNSCRSPMAESIMRKYIDEKFLNWTVDSAALRTWNVGVTPEPRCIQVLEENGLTSEHIGRVVTKEDFKQFDFILCMDDNNLEELQLLAIQWKDNDNFKAQVQLLGAYMDDNDYHIIDDPYFTNGVNCFRRVYELIDLSCRNFVQIHAPYN